MADVERIRTRLDELVRMVEMFVSTFPEIRESFRKTFNTATIQFAISGKFEPTPLRAAELKSFLARGFQLPAVDVPPAIQPFVERWWQELREELEPLVGKPVDPRFIASIHVEL